MIAGLAPVLAAEARNADAPTLVAQNVAFGIMLTRAPMRGEDKPNRDSVFLAAGTGLVLLVLLVYSLIDGFGRDRLPADMQPTTTRVLSDSIFSTYLIPFEVLSVLLLAALIGAIVIARRD